MNRQVRKRLPVQLDAGLLQPVDEAGIAQVMLTHRRVYTGNPELPKIPLLLLAVPIGVLPTLLHRVFRGPVQVLAPAKIPFGSFEYLLLTLVPRYCGGCSRHGSYSSGTVREHAIDALVVGSRH